MQFAWGTVASGNLFHSALIRFRLSAPRPLRHARGRPEKCHEGKCTEAIGRSSFVSIFNPQYSPELHLCSFPTSWITLFFIDPYKLQFRSFPNRLRYINVY